MMLEDQVAEVFVTASRRRNKPYATEARHEQTNQLVHFKLRVKMMMSARNEAAHTACCRRRRALVAAARSSTQRRGSGRRSKPAGEAPPPSTDVLAAKQ